MARFHKASAAIAAALVVLQAASVSAATLPAKKSAPKMLPATPEIAAAINQARSEKIESFMKAAATKGKLAAKQAPAGGESASNSAVPMYKADDVVRVVVELNTGSITQRLQSAGLTLNSARPVSADTWAAEIESKRAAVLNSASSNGISLQVKHTYDNALAGFSAEVRFGDIAALKAMSGVKKVSVARQLQKDDNYSTATIGAKNVWENLDFEGEGQVIAIIDTGIDYRHGELGAQDSLDPDGKVIGGHNWADADDQVIDLSGSGHGVHVAGIAAGTGDGEQHIKGVAPKAQLIAEKVFSNNPDTRSAWTDDLVAAIDDAVNADSPYHPGKKANVLNMSLGATSGFADPTDPEQIAIKNAVAAGAVVSISSGNSGYSTSALYNPYYRNQDIQAAGSPGTSLDAITVASSLNTTVTVEGRELLAKIDGAAPTSVNTVFQDGDGPFGAFETFGSESFPLALPTGSSIGCSTTDFASDYSGKIALIKRGSCTFSVKVANAAAAGAEAAIVYTQNPDPDLLTMAVGADSTIPAVMIMNSYGTELAAALGAGKTVTVAFNGGMVSKSIDDANGDTMASSSSWGTTPDLKLKPDVTAPGANIWSSIPNNQYASFSGTSMAAPHVAGASALIFEAHPDYTPADVKAALMNTAKLLYPKGNANPYSPRQQGAGRIQVDKAIATNVLVTGTDGFASLSLGELDKSAHDFTLKLTNKGAADATFDLSGAVYRPAISGAFNLVTSSVLAGASISFPNATVTVPAGETVQVAGILDLTNATVPPAAVYGVFAEGYITLTSTDTNAQPSLSVPFMGYLGNWAAPPTIDPLVDDPWSFWGETGLYYPDMTEAGSFWSMGSRLALDEDGNLTSEYSRNFFAINNDPANDLTWQKSAWPRLSFLRNARQMTIDIVDSNSKVVDKIASEEYLRNIAALTNLAYFGFWGWDGAKYNSATGKRLPVAEGHYTMRIKTLTDGKDAKVASNWQTESWPIWVDNTLPSFQIGSMPTDGFTPGPVTVSWSNATDSGSGLWGMYAILDGEVVDMTAPADSGSFTIDLPSGKHENLLICASDNAGNAGCLGTTDPFETSYISAVGPTHITTNNPYVELNLTATEEVGKITYAIGETAPIDNDTDTTIKFNLGGKDGVTDVTVKAYGLDETTELQTLTYTIDLDMTPPIMSVSFPTEQRPIVNTRTVNVTGVMSEAHPVANGVQYTTDEGAHWTNLVTDKDGNFAFTVNYTTDGRKNIKFHGTDAVGNYVEAARVFIVDAAGPVVTTAFDPAKGAAPANINVAVTTPAAYTMTGTAMDAGSGYYFTVNGQPEFYVSSDRDHAAAQNWTYDLEAVGGAAPVVLTVGGNDDAGNTSSRTLTFKSAGLDPVIAIQEITETDTTMKVTGKANAKVKSIIINGQTVKASASFSATIAKADTVTAVAFTSDPTVVGLDVKTDKVHKLADNSLKLNTVNGKWSPNGGKLRIEYFMNLKGNATVELLDNEDQVIGKALSTGVKNAGLNVFEWDGKGVTADGSYKIRVSDGVTTLTQSFERYTVAPAAPEPEYDSVLTNGKVFQLSGTVAEDATMVSITVSGPSKLEAKNIAVFEGEFNAIYEMVKDGTYTFTMTAVDELGNKSTAVTTKVTLDTTGPSKAPKVTGVPVATKADSFDATVTPSEKGYIIIEQVSGPTQFGFDPIPVADTKAIPVPFPVSNLDEGTYVYNVFSADQIHNRSQATKITFVVDRSNPTFTFTKGVDESNAGSGPKSKSYEIKFKVNDASALAPKVTFNGKSATATYNKTTGEYSVKGTLKAGENTFVFNVTDAAGNVAEQVTVTITGN